MKIKYKFVFFFLGLGFLYYFLVPSNLPGHEVVNLYSVEEYDVNPYKLDTGSCKLVIETNGSIPAYYYLKLFSKEREYYSYKDEIVDGKQYITFENLAKKEYEFRFISYFHKSLIKTTYLDGIDTISIDSFPVVSYNDSTTKSSKILTALKKKLPFKFMLSNNDRGTKTNYHFNKKKDNPSRVYRLENGKIIDSMMIDYSAFEKKLKRLIWMNENPTRRNAKKYINENGDEIVELLYTFTSHYSYILINVENNIYEISENNFDYEGKQYEFFGNFYSSFSMPKMIMKI